MYQKGKKLISKPTHYKLMKTSVSNETSNIKLVVLLIVFLLAGTGMFAQTSATSNETVAVSTNASAVESNANINVVSWFMGTKQTPKATISNDGTVGKKQMINSGIAPNRLLIKAFLKKANDFQSTIA
ncbi:hypothetical protein FNO01nite_35030 [Flavobacterium noncentrifugens]|nr:hypothetical protein FNO01nite_35030 [Flavobacterium noncentrifugens]